LAALLQSVPGMARPSPVPDRKPDRVPMARPGDSGSIGAARRALYRLSRWTLWTVVGIAVVLALIWVGSYAIDGPLTRYMERSVNERLKGYTASVRRAHFNPFNLSMNLYEVDLVQDAHPDPPVARLPRVWADLEWSSLLRARVVAKFEFIEPVLYVDRNHLQQEAQEPTPVKERGWQEALRAVYPVEMNLFRVRNGTVTYKAVIGEIWCLCACTRSARFTVSIVPGR
jgi:hypothetical protein